MTINTQNHINFSAIRAESAEKTESRKVITLAEKLRCTIVHAGNETDKSGKLLAVNFYACKSTELDSHTVNASLITITFSGITRTRLGTGIYGVVDLEKNTVEYGEKSARTSSTILPLQVAVSNHALILAKNHLGYASQGGYNAMKLGRFARMIDQVTRKPMTQIQVALEALMEVE